MEKTCNSKDIKYDEIKENSIMLDAKLRERLIHSDSLEEAKELLSGRPDLDAERIWQEIEKHRSGKNEKLDLDELDSVSGGADRDWKRDGCAATCEENSWCWSNDKCEIWDVTYDNFFVCCPDGHDHVFVGDVCTRCGHARLSDMGTH